MEVQFKLPNKLQSDIENIKKEIISLKEYFQPKKPTEYLTRQEVSYLLKIDLSSVHNWTKKKNTTILSNWRTCLL